MLIKCPDCQKVVSDKATFCLACGCPINSTTETQRENKKPPKRTPTRHRKMRNPNGYGSIRHLSGNRRKPYAAYPPITEYKDNGTGILPKALGYFETYNQALECLVLYNKSPYDVDAKTITFEEVYESFIKDKFESKKEYSRSSIAIMKAAFKNSSELHKRAFISLKTEDFQKVLDNCTLGHQSLQNILLLFKLMGKQAIKLDVIEKNYADFCRINIKDDTERGVPFFQDEIDILWKNSDNPIVQMILIMIYSGFRISAYTTIKIDLNKGYFQGGVKTAAGKNRIVPIHPKIRPFIKADMFLYFNPDYFRKDFYNTLQKLNLSTSKENTKHTPHDCRHTFSWLCDKCNVDATSKHLLMGHAIKGDVESKVYGHRTFEELVVEINKLI